MAFSVRLEAKTVAVMIEMYCRHFHQSTDGRLCSRCTQLKEYAELKINKCPFGENKPVCSVCQVHCYKPQMREEIKAIMRYSGPRMLGRHPLLAIRYLYRKRLKSSVG